jgi:Uma2 family endonuclease
MAATTHIPVELYLHSSEWDPDAEYVDGQIEERPMGEYDHADWQGAIRDWFRQHANEWNLRVQTELRVQVSKDNYRVPDVTVMSRNNPKEQIVTLPPIAVFEVLSPEDRIPRMMRKLADYSAMGVQQIWVADPATGAFMRYADGSLTASTHFEGAGIEFPFSAITELLQG